MKIFVSSRGKVNDLINKFPIEDIIVVSVTDPEEPKANIERVSEFRILRLSFHDVEANWPGLPGYVEIFDKKDAVRIRKFVVNKQRLANTIIVHCEAGISRSAAIANALNKHFNGIDDKFIPPEYYPNKTVFSILLNTLGQKQFTKQELFDNFLNTVNGNGQAKSEFGYCAYISGTHPGCAIGCQPGFKELLINESISHQNNTIQQLCRNNLLVEDFFFGISNDFLMHLQALHDKTSNWHNKKLLQTPVTIFAKKFELNLSQEQLKNLS